MLKIGLLSQLPDTDADFDDPDDEPVTIKGEPLSETVIRERPRSGIHRRPGYRSTSRYPR